jgi:hypothetical protein
MKKGFILALIVLAPLFLMLGCKKKPGDADACTNQSTDFQSCLRCCQDNGFSGASLPIDANGNTTVCECLN